MRRIFAAFALPACLALAGCTGPGTAQVCPAPVEYHETALMIGGFEGVDFLLVVDNSISMAEEQEILATSLFPLVNALIEPLPEWEWPSHEDVRVAVVTSDMGLSWGGHPYEDGDGWPGVPPCSASGDFGEFRDYLLTGKEPAIDLVEGTIPCGASGTQCPAGWACEDVDAETNVGVCNDPIGDGTGIQCPALGDEAWAWTSYEEENDGFATQVACLANQGTAGCGIEQQLQAAAVGLTREDQLGFIRPNALLVVMVISDEDDCSIEDGPSLFATDEIQGDDGPSRLNLACGNHPEDLYPIEHFYKALTDTKLSPNAVVFVGIVGVPPVDTCQGTGDELGDCLAHDDMRLEEIIVTDSSGQDAYSFMPACERHEGSVRVTRATPGRRYVELASGYFQRMSYIYSICNADWSPAMEEVSSLVASNLCGSGCFERPLPWDPAERHAICDVVVEYRDTAICPPALGDPDPVVRRETGDDGPTTSAFCELPKLSAPLDCDEVDEDAMDQAMGWYYCERLYNEDSTDACMDDLDNDGDGLTDCDDPECQACMVCGGEDSCSGRCRYDVVITDPARPLVAQRSMSVICPAAAYSDDPNCQEDSASACGDGVDNDLDGLVDCSDSFGAAETDDRTAADPDCCPMERGEGGACVNIDTSICGGMADACFTAAMINECTL
jgi:hypothetical protein